MSDLTSLFTDTLAKFSFRAVLSAAATLLICLVAVHLLGKLLRRLLAESKGLVKLVSVAPELPGDITEIRRAKHGH